MDSLFAPSTTRLRRLLSALLLLLVTGERVAISAVGASPPSSPTTRRCHAVEAMFNFGDSNSDTGGFWSAFPSQSRPFGMTHFGKPSGRASDGRLVVDFLAQALGLSYLCPYLQSVGSDFRHGVNFATLASTVLLPNTSLFVTGISPFSLAIQLNQMKEFRARVLQTRDGSARLPHEDVFGKSIYTIDIGQNDFTFNLAAIGTDGVRAYFPQVIAQIAATIKQLYAIGARTVLIFNLAPVGCHPSILASTPHNATDLDPYGCVASYNRAVDDYNRMLLDAVRQLRGQLDGAELVYVDTSSFKLDLFRNPQRHGLLYGMRACCGHGGDPYNFDPRLYCGNSVVIGGRTVTADVCDDPGSYVSWDGIHATEAANRLVAWAVLNGSYSEPYFPFSKLCRLNHIG